MHPHSYVVFAQIEQDRRRDLELAARAARARALARLAKSRGSRPRWHRVAKAARRLVFQPEST